MKSKNLKFGDMLVEVGLLSEPDLLDALQVAPQFGLPLGRTLVLSGRLSEDELELAVELQALINQKGYALVQARKAAALVRDKNLAAGEALKRIGVDSKRDGATLGSLLNGAGAISDEQLADAQHASYETGMRLGRMLVLHGIITNQLLTKALGIQTKVREGRVTTKQAIEMLAADIPKNVSAPTLDQEFARKLQGKGQVKFSEFLILSGLASEAEMLTAMETSLSKQRSLGEAMIELGLVSQQVFDRAVDLHDKVCSGTVQLKDATDEIHKIVFGKPSQASTDKSSSKTKKSTQAPVLGELLKMTGFVTDADIHDAIEMSHKYPSLIGKMLVVSGAIDDATLIASLRCQFLLKHGHIKLADAISGLKYSKQNRISFDDALDELGVLKSRTDFDANA